MRFLQKSLHVAHTQCTVSVIMYNPCYNMYQPCLKVPLVGGGAEVGGP